MSYDPEETPEQTKRRWIEEAVEKALVANKQMTDGFLYGKPKKKLPQLTLGSYKFKQNKRK